MKKIIVFALLLIITATSFSQPTKSSASLTKKDYLKKSKTQKTFAWTLAGTGVGLVVAAFATYSEKDYANTLFLQDYSAVNTSTTLFVIGGITAVSSILLFTASGRNKRKGMNLSFKNETVPQIQKSQKTAAYNFLGYPALSVKINLH